MQVRSQNGIIFTQTQEKKTRNNFRSSSSKTGTTIKGKNLLQEGQILSFKSTPYDKEGIYFMLDALFLQIVFLTHMRNVRNTRYAHVMCMLTYATNIHLDPALRHLTLKRKQKCFVILRKTFHAMYYMYFLVL